MNYQQNQGYYPPQNGYVTQQGPPHQPVTQPLQNGYQPPVNQQGYYNQPPVYGQAPPMTQHPAAIMANTGPAITYQRPVEGLNGWNDPPKTVFSKGSSIDLNALTNGDPVKHIVVQVVELQNIVRNAYKNQPSQQRMLDDLDKRMEILLDELASKSLSNELMAQLVELLRVTKARDAGTAMTICTGLMTAADVKWMTRPGTVYGSKTTVTLIPGDGIGQEMSQSVKSIFQAAGVPVEWEQYNISGAQNDLGLKKQVLDSIRRNKVALKGILMTPMNLVGVRSFNVALRKDLDIYASLSLIKNLPGNFYTRHKNVDIALIRENTEGEYSGMEHTPVPGVVESLKMVTREKTERIARFAFDFALKNGRKTVTVIHKANIMKLADGLFLNVCKEVAKQYESHGIKMKDMIVDNAAMQLVSKPQQFDVILCGNLYGNILTNVGSALVGGPGVVPGVNVGREFVVFEPGCRHVGRDLEGMNAANPATMIMSSAHLLYHIGLPQYAKQISQALMAVLGESTDLTKDLGGKTGTREFTQNVIRHL